MPFPLREDEQAVKTLYVRDLRPGQAITELFLVGSLTDRSGRRGDRYLVLTLVDATGSMRAFADLPTDPVLIGDVVRVSGRTRATRGELELIVRQMTPVDPLSYNLSDFTPTAPEATNTYLNRLSDLIAEVRNPTYHALVFAFLEDDAFLRDFTLAPASLAHHHAYVGGLLQHTVEVMETAFRSAPVLERNGLDLDLLLAAAFLHDVGKVESYTYSYPFSLTPAGRNLGHELLGLRRLFRALDACPDIVIEDAAPLLALLVAAAGRARTLGCDIGRELVALSGLDGLSAGCENRTDPRHRVIG